MTEYEQAEQDVAAAKIAERIAEWKAMEAKATYYRYASEAMAATAELMGSRIRRDNAIASEFADKAQALEAEKAVAREQLERELDAPVERPFHVYCERGDIAGVTSFHTITEARAFANEEIALDARKIEVFDGDDRLFEWPVPVAVQSAPDPDEQDDASEFAESDADGSFDAPQGETHFDEAAEAAAREERPALNADMQDDRELPITEAIQKVEAATQRLLEPEGYAPVTNPEADALAKAHDWYDPKAVADRERNAGMARLFSYNPFYKPKVDA